MCIAFSNSTAFLQLTRRPKWVVSFPHLACRFSLFLYCGSFAALSFASHAELGWFTVGFCFAFPKHEPICQAYFVLWKAWASHLRGRLAVARVDWQVIDISLCRRAVQQWIGKSETGSVSLRQRI